jgi:tRNA uridine 5-carbamoylmethylation protein Kti12
VLKLILMSGIPGSGKSRIARRLAGQSWNIASADDYPGLYDKEGFHKEYLGAAHKACFRYTLDLLAAGRRRVVVDNTNLSAINVSPYVALGRAFDYEVEIVRVLCPQLVAYRRQTHGVPLDIHRKMAERFKKFTVPAYWDVKVREA